MKTTRIATVMAAFLCGCGGGLPEGDKETAGSSDIVVCPRAVTVQGIDVSEWQGGIDWAAVARSGKAFAYARVSDGFYRDRTFAENWPAMKRAGLIRGVYQYFEPNLDPTAQAQIVIDAVGGHLEAGELPPMLDVETADPGTSAGRILWAIETWVTKIERALGKKPVIYTGSWWWNPKTGDSGQFGSYPLADSYYSQACPNIAAGWGSWTFWQYSSTGGVPGIGGHVDLDTFNGSEAELRAFAGGGTTPAGPCAGKFGNWCGSELGLTTNTLYRCVSGEPQAIEACPHGCHVNPPGVNDACNAAPPPPKGPCSGKLAGLWCGSQLGLDANELYRCSGGPDAKAAQSCQWGCKVNPLGTDDACKPQPTPPGPCTGKARGMWCGSQLGLDKTTLYSCDGGPDATPQDSCDYGCQVNPPGVNDACKPEPAPTGPCSGKAAGMWCGAQLGLDANTLYSCDGGPDETPQDTCAYGCRNNASGVAASCKPPAAGPCSGKQPGLFCGAQLGLSAGTLYYCDGDTGDATEDQSCAEGCQPMGAGTDDQCYAADCSAADDGAWCGSSNQLGGNPNILYSCSGGDVSATRVCSSACQTAPQGDSCR